MTEVLLAVTAAAYVAALQVRKRLAWPLLNPTLVAIVGVGAILLGTGIHYSRYQHSTRLLSDLLTPAVVALAVPLYREREMLRRHALPLLSGILSGAVSAFGVGWAATRLLDLGHDWSLAVLTRSATSPISIALAGELHGRAALSAVLSIFAGVVGATLGPSWLTALRVHHPLARGIAHGISSHGIGTARMVQESRLAGASSAVGMALGGTLLAVGLPLFWH
jgi:putative effector of murein hydrolase